MGRPAAALLALGVAALGLYGLAFMARLPARLPSAADWQAAREVLAREAAAGDAVLLDPPWAERAREVLGRTAPAQLAAGAPLSILSLPSLAGEELPGVRRIWLLELPRAPGHRATLGRELAGRAEPVGPTHSLGALRLAAWQLRSPELPLASLAALLSRARAEPPGAFSRQLREVDGLPRDCLFAELAPGGTARVTFEGVPLGKALRGHTGVVGEAALSGEDPVRLEVVAGTVALGAFEDPPASPGWHPFALDTSVGAGSAARVVLTLRAPRSGGPLPFCLEAFTLP